jgi:phosphoglycerate kinase
LELDSDSEFAESEDGQMEGLEFLTLDDFDLEGKKVLLRVDINSPVDEKTLMLEDGSKILSSVPTIRELRDRGARVAILAHQGRPGDYDFIPLNEHATFLSKYLGSKVRYIDDILGSYARKIISKLAEQECILLKNVRYFSEEQLVRTAEEHAKSELVRTLAPEFDLFVNDAFGSSHRSHASLVGFAPVMPAAAGRLLEKEVRTLTQVFRSPERPSTYIFGGKKLSDAVQVIGKLARDENVDNIIIAGLAGYGFLWCIGKKVGSGTEELIKADVVPAVANEARALCKDYPGKIHLPCDAAVERDGARKEYPLENLPDDASILDIGPSTIERFVQIVLKSKTVFLSGPPGVYEREQFDKGTVALFTAIADSGAFSVIGGGHSSAAANKLGLMDRISYCSTGGGALERLMLGRPMPVIEALRQSAARI